MKKSIPAVAFLIFALHAASALEIEETELRSVQANQDSVQFENYGGPHAVVETADAIINIGTELGVQVAADASNPLSVNPQGKYSLYHVVNSEETAGLDADIFFINSTAMVDHINNVRRILTGYLMAAYGYERADAETIAIFITVYNAVYRGNLSSFSGKYKNAVLVNLTEESVGLSTNWEDWAGSTQIVIPLYNGGAGEPAVVETSVISDENVIEALRQEDDKSVDLFFNKSESTRYPYIIYPDPSKLLACVDGDFPTIAFLEDGTLVYQTGFRDMHEDEIKEFFKNEE